MANRLAALLMFLTVCAFGKCRKLPSTFPVCKRNDPDLSGCFSRAVEKSLPLLKEPIPELGLPSIDPVEVESIALKSNTGSFKVDQRNVKVYNVIQTKINKSEIAFEDNKFKAVIYMYTPSFKLVSDYEFNGQVLQLPLTGKGKCQIDFEGLQSTVTMISDIIEKNDEKYLQVKEVKVEVVPNFVKLNFENLFNGDERLGAEMNKLMNENWRVLYEEVKPSHQTTIAIFFKHLVDQVFTRVPLSELFPV